MASRVCQTFSSLTVAPGAHLIDAIGGAAQGQFAQRNQVAFAEEMLDGALGLTGDIDLAFVQALAQIVGGRSTSTTSSAASKRDRGRFRAPERR
jgi:hypothetical protein